MARFFLRRRLWTALAFISLGVLVGMMFLTTPQSIGPTGVVIWFSGFYISITCLLVAASGYLFRRQPQVQLADILRSAMLATGAVVLLALSSLNQLQVRDTVLVLGLFALIALYARYSRP